MCMSDFPYFMVNNVVRIPLCHKENGPIAGHLPKICDKGNRFDERQADLHLGR